MTIATKKPIISFWIISVLALLWNIAGVFAYLSQAYMSDEIIATLSVPEQLYHNNVAPWATAAFAIAVFGGFFGSLALLFRKKISILLYIISLIAVIVQAIYNFLIQKFMPVEYSQMIWSFVVIFIAALLVKFSKDALKKEFLF
ncbi:hypothetical protein EC396_08135 [Lutibacter sp. HS1-25]|uniref:hypothetical protein n=1 Tax=Lutibacter sp. HS1-25 TaxID=2485000 RepID=UPI0010101800|nr:hypothetical protein [Lutibacter sp. HS1-25]RXP55790.1 hypothetical protein EC396_08135 [Lutibacter sp. HS1-25]